MPLNIEKVTPNQIIVCIYIENFFFSILGQIIEPWVLNQMLSLFPFSRQNDSRHNYLASNLTKFVIKNDISDEICLKTQTKKGETLSALTILFCFTKKIQIGFNRSSDWMNLHWIIFDDSQKFCPMTNYFQQQHRESI